MQQARRILGDMAAQAEDLEKDNNDIHKPGICCHRGCTEPATLLSAVNVLKRDIDGHDLVQATWAGVKQIKEHRINAATKMLQFLVRWNPEVDRKDSWEYISILHKPFGSRTCCEPLLCYARRCRDERVERHVYGVDEHPDDVPAHDHV